MERARVRFKSVIISTIEAEQAKKKHGPGASTYSSQDSWFDSVDAAYSYSDGLLDEAYSADGVSADDVAPAPAAKDKAKSKHKSKDDSDKHKHKDKHKDKDKHKAKDKHKDKHKHKHRDG